MTLKFEIKAAASPDAKHEILLYGDIGESYFGETISAQEFAKTLATLPPGPLVVRMSSHGGSVADGLAIYNSLMRHDGDVRIEIEGVAVSIASLIAMAGAKSPGSTTAMHDGSLFMLHAPWLSVSGNEKDLLDAASMLRTYAEAMSGPYAKKCGKPKDEMLALLIDGQDHWYTATQAKEAGFIDEIITGSQIVASHDLSRYKNLPQGASVFTPKADAMPGNDHATDTKEAQAVCDAQPETDPQIHKEQDMEKEQMDAVKAQVKAENLARIASVQAVFKPLAGKVDGLAEVEAKCVADMDCTAEKAQAEVLALIGKQSQPVMPRIETLQDESDKQREGAVKAILHRASMKGGEQNEFTSMTLMEMTKHFGARAGLIHKGMQRREVAAAGFHSTSDMSWILKDVMYKTMLMGYEETPETWGWVAVGSLPDFRQSTRVALNSYPNLVRKVEGGEYTRQTISDRGENVQLYTYGGIFEFTRELLQNDDLNALAKIPYLQGRAAKRTIGDAIYNELTANGNMADGQPVFSLAAGNLLTGSAINTASVDLMRVAIATQKLEDGTRLGLRLNKIIVPVALEGAAKMVAESMYEVGATAKNNTTPNIVRGTFEVISDSRLDDVSASAWYGIAGNGAESIELSYLDGNSQPFLETDRDFATDGIRQKARIDFGVKTLDRKTMAKNPGA